MNVSCYDMLLFNKYVAKLDVRSNILMLCTSVFYISFETHVQIVFKYNSQIFGWTLNPDENAMWRHHVLVLIKPYLDISNQLCVQTC